MIFKIKKKVDKLSEFKHKEYNHGDIKEVKKFAFKPKRIGNKRVFDIVIWLESYYEVYEYVIERLDGTFGRYEDDPKKYFHQIHHCNIYRNIGWQFKEYKLK